MSVSGDVMTGDATLTLRANVLRQYISDLLDGNVSAYTSGNALCQTNVPTVQLVGQASRDNPGMGFPGLDAWRSAYGDFLAARDAVQANGVVLAPVVVSEPPSLAGWKIPGTNIIVPWLAVVAVVGFIGVAWYINSGSGRKRA